MVSTDCFYVLCDTDSIVYYVVVQMEYCSCFNTLLIHVSDYFDFRIIWEYVFNVADIFVVVGTILLCIYILFFEDKEQVK